MATSTHLRLHTRVLLVVFVIASLNKLTNAWTDDTSSNVTSHDTCFEERGGIFPCSSTITGNLILMVFYGALLGLAAKFISDGAEMLLEFGLPPGVIGGVVLPVLGAVPDCAIILASGLGEGAQEKLSVGMGTLAGSTVMLLTVAWSASLFVGRCDFNAKGESIDKTLTTSFSLTKQGITLLPDIKRSIILMFVTSLAYFVVQSADWYWGATLTVGQPKYVRDTALATMVICIVALMVYLIFSILDSKANERLVRLHREELLKRHVLHTMIMMSSKVVPEKKAEEPTSPTTPAATEKKYFKAWKMKTGTKAINEKLGLLEGEDSKDESEDMEAQPIQQSSASAETSESKESKIKSVLTCICLLVGGVALVTIFSDPMCDVLTALTNKNNKSFLPIPAFYVSFVVTPFCSNASELVSSLIFASKKTRENSTMTYSQIFGAATMNNTLCMAIFMALVYFKDLEWIYGAEVVCIIVVQWVVGLVSLRGTYKMWMGIPVAFTYVICILIVYLLEFKAGWN